MSKVQSRAEIEICGEVYVLKGDAAPEHLYRLGQYVDRKIKEAIKRNPKLSASKAAILVALSLADEFSKLQDDYDSLVKVIDSDKKKD